MQTHKKAAPGDSGKTLGGDDKSVWVLAALEQYEQPLTSFACRLFHGDLHAARDAVQFTFMQLCRQSPEAIEHKLKSWLYSVCRNHIFDQLKSQSRRTCNQSDFYEEVDSRAIDPSAAIEKVDLLRELKRLCRCLNESEQEVIDLWSHGFKPVEIAEMTGKTNGAVRVSLHRAIKRLRQHPKVLTWLERATGQIVGPDDDSNSTSKINGIPTPTFLGEQK